MTTDTRPPFRTLRTGRDTNGVVMVAVEDVLAWLRIHADRWEAKTPHQAHGARVLADDLCSAWIEASR